MYFYDDSLESWYCSHINRQLTTFCVFEIENEFSHHILQALSSKWVRNHSFPIIFLKKQLSGSDPPLDIVPVLNMTHHLIWGRYDSFHFHYPPPPITINMSHMIWLFIISPMEMAILRVKLVWLLDALWRPLFLVIKSSWSLLGTSSKYDSGRLEQYMKNLRNFHKIYAFRPEVYLELFQVQIRTAL